METQTKEITFIYKYKKGNCKHCDNGGKPNSAGGAHHINCSDLNFLREYSDKCGNILTEEDFNLLYDLDEASNFRSHILGKPIYDMKCSKCFKFVGAYHHSWECTDKFCSNCGNNIKR